MQITLLLWGRCQFGLKTMDSSFFCLERIFFWELWFPHAIKNPYLNYRFLYYKLNVRCTVEATIHRTLFLLNKLSNMPLLKMCSLSKSNIALWVLSQIKSKKKKEKKPQNSIKQECSDPWGLVWLQWMLAIIRPFFSILTFH